MAHYGRRTMSCQTKPCANCLKANVECRVVPPQPPRRRKKKPHERDLIERLKKYESLLSQHGVNFEHFAHDLKPGDIADDVTDLEQDLGGLKTSPSSGQDHVSPDDADANKKWVPYFREYRHADAALDSSDEETERPTIHHAFDNMFDNSDGFPFTVGGAVSSVTHQHPSAIQIFQLWQIYISNVNPLLKLNHIPTLQAQIITASASTAKIARPLEALMFAIYLIAVTSMTEHEAQSTFAEDKFVMLKRFHDSCQQALVNAGFMRSSELMVLQAFILYLLAVRQYVDPRALFCLIGISVRIATRLGLHRDGAQVGMPPFEVEMRRRLWWQLVIFDKRIAEITGSGINALSSSHGDTKFPLNVNDTDLNDKAKDAPPPYSGPTEMLFSLTRFELCVAAAPNGLRPVAASPPTSTGGGTKPASAKTRVQFSPAPSSPDVMSQVATNYLPENLHSFCEHMESNYLRYCDPKIPLHSFTLLSTRAALSKLRLVEVTSRGICPDTLGETERDAPLVEAIQMLEYDNAILRTEELQGFKWYMELHVPFPAYIYISNELKSRTSGDLCERAWSAFLENHDRRGMMKKLRSPMHMAVGGVFVKAWDAHEQAAREVGRDLATPKVIDVLRQIHTRMRGRPPPNGGFGQHFRLSGPRQGGDGGPSAGPGPESVAASDGSMAATSPAQGTPMAATVSSPMGSASATGAPMYATPHKGRPEIHQQPPTAGHAHAHAHAHPHSGGAGTAGGMMLDDTAMFSGFEGVNPMYGQGLQDVEYGQMDWNYLVPAYSGVGSFSGYAGAMYHPPGAPPHGHHHAAWGDWPSEGPPADNGVVADDCAEPGAPNVGTGGGCTLKSGEPLFFTAPFTAGGGAAMGRALNMVVAGDSIGASGICVSPFASDAGGGSAAADAFSASSACDDDDDGRALEGPSTAMFMEESSFLTSGFPDACSNLLREVLASINALSRARARS
ncbi:hypothetical protein P8C59_006814 [Phyllachora maydis]|uniref:Xylanolytic transcriptional activator regulatory domain-containing protein n=1 Tax=Phyllachora maydis TaxID=1825666 RepID=A0AAD9I896_9PEZI|nr:hypothetical protein P8C59_006814 [Phyllachora maydis]